MVKNLPVMWETQVLWGSNPWPPNAKRWLIERDPDAGKDWKQGNGGWKRIRWLDGITGSMDMNLGKLKKMVRDREAWHATLHGITKSGTWPGDWTTKIKSLLQGGEQVWRKIWEERRGQMASHQDLSHVLWWKWQPTPVLLPGASHGWRSLVGYSPWGCKIRHDWATTSFPFTFSLWLREEWEGTSVGITGPRTERNQKHWVMNNSVRLVQGRKPRRASANGGPVSSEHQRQEDDAVDAQGAEKVRNAVFTLASFPHPFTKLLLSEGFFYPM